MNRLYKELQKIDSIQDKLGRGIDDSIKITVALLRCHGFNTTSSCEGHNDSVTGGPYIDVESPLSSDIFNHLRSLAQPSLEYVHSRDKLVNLNLENRYKLYSILTRFYQDNKLKDHVSLIIISERGLGASRIEVHGASVVHMMSDKEHRIWLEKAKDEFSRFTDYLHRLLTD